MAADETGPFTEIRRKLIETKQAWARDGRLLTGRAAPRTSRLPPGQREVKNWPVLDLGVQPEIPAQRWTVAVDGLVEIPLVWDWDAFRAQPVSRQVSDIHCVTAWSRFDNAWEGVSARHVLECVRPKPEAFFVVLHAYDDYTTNLPLMDFGKEGVLLAHSWQGRPLTRAHGAPVRAIIPQLYFWKSAKWISRIEFVGADRPGFWEQRGYHNRADPWAEERYS
jgi:DMSO/TMAO reductase YedYZ molybdopterin-dependent catalytic subunit